MKIMKNLLSAVTACALASMVWQTFPASVDAETSADMSPTAEEIVSDMTIGWNLGNDLDTRTSITCDVPQVHETYWGNPPATKEMLQLVRESGFDTIRIPVTWGNKMNENFQVSEVWMNRVQEIVDDAYNAGFYVILNIHHDTGEEGWIRAAVENYEENHDKVQALWTQIAERFEGYDYHLLFEGFNEMINDENNWWDPDTDGTDAINLYNQLFVDTVRSTGGNNAERVLICNTYAASGSSAQIMRNFVMPEDTVPDKLIAEVHNYTPWEFCDYSAPDVTDYSSSELDWMFGELQRYLMHQGFPVIIGEFGASNKDQPNVRIQWFQEYLSKAADLGIPCVIWDDGNYDTAYGLMNRRGGYWQHPELVEGILAAVGIEYDAPPVPEYDRGDNLASDPFGYKNWFNNNGAGYIENYEPDADSVTLNVVNGGNSVSDMVLFYESIPVQKGHRYRISFDIHTQGLDSIIRGDMALLWQSVPDTFQAVTGYSMQIGSEPERKTFLYTADRDMDVRLNIDCGSLKEESYQVVLSGLMVQELQSGDVNLDKEVTVADAVSLLKYLLGTDGFTDEQFWNADVYADEKINGLDLAVLRGMLVTGDLTDEP